MQIAHNPLFTAREKIDLLNRLKAEVTGQDVNPDHLAFDPERDRRSDPSDQTRSAER